MIVMIYFCMKTFCVIMRCLMFGVFLLLYNIIFCPATTNDEKISHGVN